MRFNKILSGMIVLAGMTFLSGCSNEPYEITREEQYARDFINTFGLIAPGHDWTAAQHSDVTVNTASPTTVKIYADFNGETYLFGKYDVEAGSTPLKFDIPKGATNYRLKANGRKLAFTPGQTVDLTNGSRNETTSHGAGEINTKTGLGESGTYAGVKVDITPNEFGRYLTLMPKTMTEAIDKKLPENGDPISAWSASNMDVYGVYDNFSVTAKEFFLFPEYWETSKTDVNIIGIYWETTPGTEGSEEIKITDPDGTEHIYNIIRVPVMQNPSKLMIPCTTSVATYENFNNIPDWDNIFNVLMRNYPEKYYITDGSQKNEYGVVIEIGKKYHIFADGVAREISTTRDQGTWGDVNHEIGNDIASIYPIFYVHDWGVLAQNTLVDSPYSGDAPGTATVSGANYYKSYGIHIVLDQARLFGFYIQQDKNVMYSQSKLNEWVTKLNDKGEEEAKQPSYVATYSEGSDTEGNDKRHLCFEDWYKDNWDINDMIFRVYGFDYLKNPEKPITTGSVVDEDKNPTPPVTPPVTPPTPGPGDGNDDNTTDKAFQWVVACEDLGGTDDYDFNDVVFGVEHVSGEREVKVTALAAGGTLETKLFYNGHEITGGPKKDTAVESTEFYQYTEGSGDTFTEWHQWFGNYPHTSMINTSSFSGIGATVVLVLPENEGKSFTMTNSAHSTENFGGFSVQVINTEGTKELSAPVVDETGAIAEKSFPQMFVTTNNYKWPTERTPIYESHMGDTNQEAKTTVTFGGKDYKVYPNSFHDWVQNNSEGFHTQAPTGSVITWRKAD